ncbi:MAG: bile acid:sodium symporter family protein [Gammaproteobacteria bacterium]|nr:MAG: bile acid:sodium symporter family protein [Gammaproteobacteria bacterium]
MHSTMQVIVKVAPAALILMMVGMGMCLTKADFVRIVRYPKAVVAGSLMQFLLIPVVGYLLVLIFQMRPELAVGFMILAACPGGPGSNLVAFMCRGDAALSVSLTVVSSLYTIITIPIIIQVSLDAFAQNENAVQVSVIRSGLTMLVLAVLPIAFGMIINRYKPELAKKMVKPVKVASLVLLLLLVAAVFVKQGAILFDYIRECGIVGYALCFITMGSGYIIARVLGLPEYQKRSISIEVGIQNGAMAVVIATTLLENQAMAIPAIVYSPVMISVSFVLIVVTWITRHGLD